MKNDDAHVARVTREAQGAEFIAGAEDAERRIAMLLADDGCAASHQTIGQYRASLLRVLRSNTATTSTAPDSSPAARPAPAPEGASGETNADFESALDRYRDDLFDRVQIVANNHIRLQRDADRTELRRLYRAATGEVVGTAELYDSHVGHLQETHPYPRDAMIPVDLVRRREKEEG